MLRIATVLAFVVVLDAGAADKRFETASVRPVSKFAGQFPARRTIGGPGTGSPGRIEYQEQSLKALLFMAYRVSLFQLRTASWMEDAYFTVQATMPVGSTHDDVAEMLQNLLIERFGLKMRREPKEMKGYALTVARGGPKFKESPTVMEPAPERLPGTGFQLDSEGFIIATPGAPPMLTMPSRNGIQRLTGTRASMEVLRVYLIRQLQQPVLDETGLKGIYDFRLAFAPEISAPGAQLPEPGPAGEASAPAPTLVNGIEAQLGLKLTARTVTVETLVIDHIERTPVEQ